MTWNLPARYHPVIIQVLRKALAQGHPITVTIRGTSMLPTLQPGDRVQIVPVDPAQLQPGDLVAYVDARHHIFTHPIIRLAGDTFITQGDNRAQPDPAIPLQQILGQAHPKDKHP